MRLPFPVALALAATAALTTGCSCSSTPAPTPDVGGPSQAPASAFDDALDPGEDDAPVWRRARALSPDKGLEPGVRARLSTLEADYFAGKHEYVISSAEQLLDLMPDADPELKLRLYYLLARSHARNRNPGRARHYEELFRKLHTELYGQDARGAASRDGLEGFVEAGDQIVQAVNPGWDTDGEGMTWANVRIQRELDRAGPREVLTRDHPGGGTIHAAFDPESLEEFRDQRGMDPDEYPIQRDQRFGFYFVLEGGR